MVKPTPKIVKETRFKAWNTASVATLRKMGRNLFRYQWDHDKGTNIFYTATQTELDTIGRVI